MSTTLAARDNGAGRVQVGRDTQRAREVVGRAQGQQAEDGAVMGQQVDGGAHRTVAAAQDDEVAARIERGAHRRGQPRRTARGVEHGEGDAQRRQQPARASDLLPPATRPRIHDQGGALEPGGIRRGDRSVHGASPAHGARSGTVCAREG